MPEAGNEFVALLIFVVMSYITVIYTHHEREPDPHSIARA
jgi:hypothetical protein